MIKLYPNETLGRYTNDWLDSRHHFSFGEYHNPARMRFGTLRVINDDVIKAGTGFDFHPHQDMEIITYVREGTILHRDSLGNNGRTLAGDVQVMSAGTGIVHAEYADPELETRIFQIWITPREKGVLPRWDSAQFPKGFASDTLPLLVSGRDKDRAQNPLFIHQDAAIYGGRLRAGQSILHTPFSAKAYLLASSGRLHVEGKELTQGDGAEITGQEPISITAITDSELLVIEV